MTGAGDADITSAGGRNGTIEAQPHTCVSIATANAAITGNFDIMVRSTEDESVSTNEYTVIAAGRIRGVLRTGAFNGNITRAAALAYACCNIYAVIAAAGAAASAGDADIAGTTDADGIDIIYTVILTGAGGTAIASEGQIAIYGADNVAAPSIYTYIIRTGAMGGASEAYRAAAAIADTSSEA